MFTCKIKNTSGDVLTLTQNESEYQLYNINGLNPPNAQINTSDVANIDGTKFNSAKLLNRELVLYIKLNGNVEANRIMLYRFFSTKENCSLFYTNEHRDVFIEGYVQSVEVTPFTDNEIMQVSILCPQPYFKSVVEFITDVSNVLAVFEFPFIINYNNPVVISTLEKNKTTNVVNDSESETGVTVTINILNTINRIMIRNVNTGESITVYDANGFRSGDMIIINTNKGEKSIKLFRDGVYSNLFTKLLTNSVFFQLAIGDNYFGYSVDNSAHDDYVNISFKHYSLYRGV